MTDLQLKNHVGILFVTAHLLIIILLMSLPPLINIEFEEATTAVALVTPIFATYATVIIRFFIEHQHLTKQKGKKMTPIFIKLAFAMPCLFVVLVISIISLWVFNRLTFDQFKTVFTVIESLFAVYVGQFISSLFDKKQ